MSASGRFLLDTNIIIALLEGDEAVLSNLDRVPEVFVPAIVLGELFFGAAKSGRPDENAAKLEQFAAGRFILPCDLRVAREYGRLKQDLRAKGSQSLRMTSGSPPPPFPMNWFLPHVTGISADLDGLIIANW